MEVSSALCEVSFVCQRLQRAAIRPSRWLLARPRATRDTIAATRVLGWAVLLGANALRVDDRKITPLSSVSAASDADMGY